MSPVVAAWLELVEAEHRVRHHEAAAVPGEASLQLVVSHLLRWRNDNNNVIMNDNNIKVTRLGHLRESEQH